MKKLLINASAVLAATFISSPLASLAQSGGAGDLLNPVNRDIDVQSTLEIILQTVLDWMLIIAGFLAVIYLVWAGIQYITGGAENAKKQIINAVIGVIVIILAYAIINAALSLVTI